MLHRRKTTSQITKMYVEVHNHQIPVVIYRERRRDWRIAVGQKAVNLRIPNIHSRNIAGDPFSWAQDWIKSKYEEDPSQFYHFTKPPPAHGKLYQTLFGDFELNLHPADLEKVTGKIRQQKILLSYPGDWPDYAKAEVFPKAVSRLFALHFRPLFSARVAELNERYYQFNYHRISFKYNTSNWGSCSSKGNLNFSTRLFLAPQIVADYVIIHELAHLQIQNHSAAFWSLVRTVMPDYQDHSNWLKEHGQHLYF